MQSHAKTTSVKTSPAESKNEPALGFKLAELKSRQAFADKRVDLLIERIGQGIPESNRPFQLDLLPLRMDDATWTRIEAGIGQRIKAFSRFVDDIYSERRILQDGILPPEIIYEDPLFFPELHNIGNIRQASVILAATDLVQTDSGEWQVVENQFSTPTGIARMLQVRRILSETLPEPFRENQIETIQSFPWRFYEHLSAQASLRNPQPNVVLLSEGVEGKNLPEEQFLAREMGIPLAHSRDLLVRNSTLFLRTIDGLIKVDLVYRRLEAPFLDPVSFSANRASGIPGLLHCLRKGTVRLLNSPASAVADNRALLRHADAIIQYYLHQSPILKTVPTYYGYDSDQADFIKDNARTLKLKPVCHESALRENDGEQPDLMRLLNRDPRKVVAQAFPQHTLFKGTTGESVGHHCLRVFSLGAEHPYILPGGLCSFIQDPNVPAAPKRLRDTWINRRESPRQPEPLEPDLLLTIHALPSSVAENMYWLSRYLERGISGCRFFACLDKWLDSGKRLNSASILTDGILGTLGINRKADLKPQSLQELLTPDRYPNSPTSAFMASRRAMQSLRDYLDEESCRAIQALAQQAQDQHTSPNGREVAESLIKTASDCNWIFGHMERHLMKDSGWHFFRLGQLIERAHVVSSLSARILPDFVQRQIKHRNDESELNDFLELTDSLNLYHRVYHSRAYLDRTLQLVWKSETSPMSLLFILKSATDALSAIQRETQNSEQSEGLLTAIRSITTELQDLPIDHILPDRRCGTLASDKDLQRSAEQIHQTACQLNQHFQDLHTLIDDLYFCHQVNSITNFQDVV